jgi:phage gpG-like protein
MAGFPSVRGLRLHDGIVSFEFKPTLGILARDVDKLGIDIRSFREPLTRAVKEVMIPSIKKNFDSQGRPGWEPLAEDTLLLRDRIGKTGPILNRSGLLKRNMSYQTMWSITQEFAIIKDLPQRVWYGKVHQEGRNSMRTRMKSEVQKAAKQGIKLSPDKAAQIVQARIDQELLSGQGSKHSSTNIPARPFVMFQDEDYDDIEEVFGKWLQERIDRTLRWR